MGTFSDLTPENEYEIIGASDGTKIGNDDDALKTKITNADEDDAIAIKNVGSQLDQFGRLRTSSPNTLFQSSHVYSKEDLVWDESTSNGASIDYEANESCVCLNVTTASGSKAIRQTKRRIQYFKGKSQLIDITFSGDSYEANTRARYGFFDSQDGLFLEVVGADPFFVRRSSVSGSVVDNRVAQSNWNVDKLDGTGPSGVTLDLSKVQLFWIDFSWLGVNHVRYGFVLDGKRVVCHSEKYTNVLSTVYMQQAILPIRVELENTGAISSPAKLSVICQHVASEGPLVKIGRVRTLSNGDDTIGVSSTPRIIAGLRLKPDATRLSAKILLFNLFRTSNDDTIWYRLLFNPDLSNESPQWSNLDGQCQRLSNTFTQSGGYDAEFVIDEGYMLPNKGEDASDSIEISNVLEDDVYLGAGIDGTPDEICLELRRITGGGTQQILYTMKYQEFF